MNRYEGFEPNFTIILPGGCSAKCDFCTERYNVRAARGWVDRVVETLPCLPRRYKQVSISGGEPSTSKHLLDSRLMSALKGSFSKIVLTTNAQNPARLREYLETHPPTHLNVSRHFESDQLNADVFGVRVASNTALAELMSVCDTNGVDTNINAVYSFGGPDNSQHPRFLNQDDPHFKSWVTGMVDYVRNIGARTLTIRQDHNRMQQLVDVRAVFDLKPVAYKSCPVCSDTVFRMKGVEVHMKTSTAEPEKVGTRKVATTVQNAFELILRPDGKVYSSWVGGEPLDLEGTDGPEPRTSQVTRRIPHIEEPSFAIFGGGCRAGFRAGCRS